MELTLPPKVTDRAFARLAEIAEATGEVKPLVEELNAAIGDLDRANQYPDGVEGLELAEYARDRQLAAMVKVREAADILEKVVADDLWPLPTYQGMLFIL